MMTRLISDYLSRLTALPQSIVSLRIKQHILIESGDRTPYTVGIKGNSNMELMIQLKQADSRIRIENLNDNSMPTIYNVCYNRGVYISKAFFSRELPPLVSIPLATNIQFSCGVIYRSEPSLTVQKFLQLVEEYKHTLV